MFACVARSFGQVVLGLSLGLVPCRTNKTRTQSKDYVHEHGEEKGNRELQDVKVKLQMNGEQPGEVSSFKYSFNLACRHLKSRPCDKKRRHG